MSSDTRGSIVYRAVAHLARAAIWLFYSTVEITGLERLDPTHPTLYAPTHPNSIVDPLLLMLFEDRPLRFVARDGLFRVPGLGAILRAIGAVPVRRRMDHAGNVDNRGALAECASALAAGGAVVLFPEGKTHARLRVEPLKTGLARIALDACPAKVRIVPIGLNYLVRHAFRSDVHVAIGEPIELDERLETADRDAAVRELTARVQASLEAQTVHIEREDDERMIAQVTAIIAELREKEGLDPYGQSPAERVALVQRIVDAYRWLRATDPVRTERLRRRILDLIEEREALGLGGQSPAFQHRGERRRAARIWREARTSILVLGAPLAAYGIATHAIPYLVMRGILTLSPPRRYRGALVKLLLGALLFAAFYGLTASVVWSQFGPIASSVYAMTLVPAGLFARRYLVEVRLGRLGPSGIVRFLRHRSRVAIFEAERRMLADDLAALRDAYLSEAA